MATVVVRMAVAGCYGYSVCSYRCSWLLWLQWLFLWLKLAAMATVVVPMAVADRSASLSAEIKNVRH